ncbi:hypothetical protein PG993_004683 [Apiospora rasikravindrae]|uniref:Uncharacterized protein n=1 Tax=Apiospora rasikravindrae TaxID=990691 RepID=A0ABR1TFZ6_9PEZI
MPSNKPRLYIALFARGGAPRMPNFEDKYHWSFIVGPKNESEGSRGTKFHVKNFVGSQDGVAGSMWQYEEAEVPMAPVSGLLVRVMIAKVNDKDRLQEVFRGIPTRPSIPGWNCVGWVKEAVEALASDPRALGTCAKDWVGFDEGRCNELC